MITAKQEAFQAIASLPDDAPIDDIMYRLFVIDKISHGQDAIENGDTYSTEALLKEVESW